MFFFFFFYIIKNLKRTLNMGAPPNIAPIAPNKTNNDNDTTKRTLTLKLKSSMNEHANY